MRWSMRWVVVLCLVVIAGGCTRDAATSTIRSGAADTPAGANRASDVGSESTWSDGWACKRVDPVRLFDAALSNNAKRVRALLDRCVPEPDTTRQDDVAMHRATYAAATAAFGVLLEAGADPDYEDASGETALTWAARPASDNRVDGTDRRKAAITRVLLRAGASVDHRGNGGIAALHQAASGNFTRTVGRLLNAGATVDARTRKRITPLMVAASQGYGRIVTQLLDAGARPALRDKSGQTAADKAREGGFERLARRLERAGG